MAKSYEIKLKGWSKLQKALKRNPEVTIFEVAKAIKTSINTVRPIMRAEAPHDKGKLRENIFARYANGKGYVGPDLKATPYAYWVHEGTDPYIIRAKPGKALYWKGARHPVKSVRHPGIAPNKFIERTVKIASPYVNVIFNNALKNIIKNLKK